MVSFAAAEIVEKLDYDLRPYADSSGTITEPTSLQLQTYLDATRQEIKRAQRESGISPGNAEKMTAEEAILALEPVDPKRFEAARKRSADITSALCSGTPSAADLMKLPHRVRVEFSSWLTGQLLNPDT